MLTNYTSANSACPSPTRSSLFRSTVATVALTCGMAMAIGAAVPASGTPQLQQSRSSIRATGNIVGWTSFREGLNRICLAVDLTDWRGRAGTTDLDVIREFLSIAVLRGTLVIGLNLRSIAERCGISVSTAWLSTERLKS